MNENSSSLYSDLVDFIVSGRNYSSYFPIRIKYKPFINSQTLNPFIHSLISIMNESEYFIKQQKSLINWTNEKESEFMFLFVIGFFKPPALPALSLHTLT